MNDDKVFQEFYCGNCQGHIRVRLNMAYDRAIFVCCPQCKHEHQRYIEKGQILENGRFDHGNVKEKICPPLSAYNKEPITKRMKKAEKSYHDRRDGVVIKSSDDLVADSFLRERWIELYGNERG